MKRLLASLRWNVVQQYRNGFYFASAFFVLIWVVLLRFLFGAPFGGADRLMAALLVLNLVITAFYYIGAIVLLEKGEGTLGALVVTPLRRSEYLAAQAGSLMLLALLESLLIVAAAYPGPVAYGPLVAGTLLLSVLYVLLGFVAIVRYDAINEYLIPSGGFVILLALPLVDFFGLWRSPLFYLHPTQPALVLLHAGFAPAASWKLAYGALGALLWCGAGFAWASRKLHRFVVRSAGT